MIEEKNTVFNFVDITMARTYKVYRDLRELSAEEIEEFRKVMINGKSGTEIMLYNFYTAYIQRLKLFLQLFERLIFVIIEEE